MWYNLKEFNIHLTRVPQGEEIDGGVGTTFKEIIETF